MNDLGRHLRMMLDDVRTPVLHIHDAEDEGAQVAIVNPDWLADIWEAAVAGGREEAGWGVTDAGREAGFMPHEHSEPSDRDA